jgi:hypothetical protein
MCQLYVIKKPEWLRKSPKKKGGKKEGRGRERERPTPIVHANRY